MSPLVEKLECQAEKLSPRERECLAQRLLAGLRAEPLTEVDEAWVREADRRYRLWKRDRTRARPAEKALAQLRKGLER
jgi:hypothetical protein